MAFSGESRLLPCFDVDHVAQVEALHNRGARSTAAGFAAGAFYDAEEGQAPQPALRLSCDL
jgi:hypothetical protein